MFRTTSWAGVAILCACTARSGAQNPLPAAPAPREKPADDAWLPKPGSDPNAEKSRIKDLAPAPPSAFPEIVPPEVILKVPNERDVTFEKMCPRLFGKIALKIDPADDTLRKLLKARLYQGTLEFQQTQRMIWGPILGIGPDHLAYRVCLLDMQAAATELWANQPKELAPWLEELLVMAKESERLTRIRTLNGSVPPNMLNGATNLRLKMEAELWKAKNPK